MSVQLRQSANFAGDFDLSYRWYLVEAGETIARRFLESVWQTLAVLAERPGMGKARRFRHTELQGLRSFPVRTPFQAHLIFYRSSESGLSVERLMHGARDLPRRLRELPGASAR